MQPSDGELPVKLRVGTDIYFQKKKDRLDAILPEIYISYLLLNRRPISFQCE